MYADVIDPVHGEGVAASSTVVALVALERAFASVLMNEFLATLAFFDH